MSGGNTTSQDATLPNSADGSATVIATVRRAISNVSAASTRIAAQAGSIHREYTRRDAGPGVGATVAWTLANALWKLSNSAFTASAMAISAYPNPTVTVSMQAVGGFLGSAADIGTCYFKRDETRDTLNKFISLLQEPDVDQFIESISYKNALTEKSIDYTASTIGALGTLPIMTVTNWLVTLCLQQERQIALATQFILRKAYSNNPHGHDQLIDILTKLKVYKNSDLIRMSSTPASQASDNTTPNIPTLSPEQERLTSMRSGDSRSVITPAEEIATNVVLSDSESDNIVNVPEVQRYVEEEIVRAASETGIDRRMIDSIIGDVRSLFDHASEIVQEVASLRGNESATRISDSDDSGSFKTALSSNGSNESQRLSDAREALNALRQGSENLSGAAAPAHGFRRYASAPARTSSPDRTSPWDIEKGSEPDVTPGSGSSNIKRRR